MKKALFIFAIFAFVFSFKVAAAAPTAIMIEPGAQTVFDLPNFTPGEGATNYRLEIDGPAGKIIKTASTPSFKAISIDPSFKYDTPIKYRIFSINQYGETASPIFEFLLTKKEIKEAEFSLNDALILNAIEDIYNRYYEAKGVSLGAFISALNDVSNEAVQSIRAQARYSFGPEDVKTILGTNDNARVELIQNIRESEMAGKRVSFVQDVSKVSPVFGQYVPPAAPAPSFTKRIFSFFTGLFSRKPAEVAAPAEAQLEVRAKSADLEIVKKDLERVQYLERVGLLSLADISGIVSALNQKSASEKVQAKKAAYITIAAVLADVSKWGLEQDVDQTIYLITETAKNLITGSQGKRLTGDALTKAVNDIYQKNLEQYKKQFEVLGSKDGIGEPSL